MATTCSSHTDATSPAFLDSPLNKTDAFTFPNVQKRLILEDPRTWEG